MTRKIIIDCDPGIDDSLAIMLALSMPEEASVLGITVAAGNAPVEMGAGNARKILRFMDRLDIPVFEGAAGPLKRDLVDALDTHGPDGLGGSFLPEVEPAEYANCARYKENLQEILPDEPPAVRFPAGAGSGSASSPSSLQGEPPAVRFLADTLLRQERGSVDIVALGPLTNLARLAAAAPEAFDRIGELISMGGSFQSHGNCSPVAEYNYWCDPDAARIVFAQMNKRDRLLHMAGLDVTRRIVLTPSLLDYMKRLDARIGGFVEKITKFYFDFHWEWEHLIGCVINDPLAMAYYFRRDLCGGFESYVDIETEGICRGQSVVDAMHFYRHRPNAVVLTEVDAAAFFRFFFAKLLHIPEEELDLIPDLVHTRRRNTEKILERKTHEQKQ